MSGTSKVVTLSAPPELIDAVKARAQRWNRSFSAEVREALTAHLVRTEAVDRVAEEAGVLPQQDR